MTLQDYVKQALSLHRDLGLPSPSLADVNYIKIMTTALKKYKLIPKHKEMIINSMLHHIEMLYKHTPKDAFIHSVMYWIILGCYTDFSKSEWCSDHHETFDTAGDLTWGDHPMSLPVIADEALPPKQGGKFTTLRPPMTTPTRLRHYANTSRITMTMAN